MQPAVVMPPLGRPDLPPILLDPERGAPVGLGGRDALVVEDDESAADIAQGLLGLFGYRARVAWDGHAALYEVSRRIPDFILLDIHLPEMDGISFLRVLRKVREAKDVPVVAVSAVYPPDGPVARMLAGLGVSNYLSKPFHQQQLREAILEAHPDGPLQLPAAPPASPSARSQGPWQEWGLPCRGWFLGGEHPLILEHVSGSSIDALAAPGLLQKGATGRLEARVRRVVRDAMTETIVRLLVRVVRPAGRKGGSERWSLEVQAVRPEDGLDRVRRALKD